MTRDITADTVAASAAPAVRVAVLVALNFESGWLRLWSGLGPLIWLGDEFTGAAGLLGLSQIEESGDTRAAGFSLSLSGIPAALTLPDGRTMLDAVRDEEGYQGRAALLWYALLNDDGGFIGAPVRLARGRMDRISVQIGDTLAASLSIEPRTIDMERPRIRRYTSEDQQAEYPGDLFFSHVDKIAAGVNLRWGRS